MDFPLIVHFSNVLCICVCFCYAWEFLECFDSQAENWKRAKNSRILKIPFSGNSKKEYFLHVFMCLLNLF
jgi:hypothetical protein